MNRKEFIESQGATCKNWYWSWSFINKSARSIIFGAWDRNTNGKTAIILSEDWQFRKGGKKNASYRQSIEHIRLIQEEGYRLMTFPMQYSDANKLGDGSGPAKIGGFTPKLIEKTLTKIGKNWYAVDGSFIDGLAEELPAPEKYSEGARIMVTINAYERNAQARVACIKHHGCKCAVCGFNFVQVYGALGEGFIHVHHVVSIGKIGKQYEIDPVTDLIPVCPNCHAMIHRTEPLLTVEQLRDHLYAQRKVT